MQLIKRSRLYLIVCALSFLAFPIGLKGEPSLSVQGKDSSSNQVIQQSTTYKEDYPLYSTESNFNLPRKTYTYKDANVLPYTTSYQTDSSSSYDYTTPRYRHHYYYYDYSPSYWHHNRWYHGDHWGHHWNGHHGWDHHRHRDRHGHHHSHHGHHHSHHGHHGHHGGHHK